MKVHPTLHALADRDRHADIRKGGQVYDVETVSLNDLLDQHDAPAVIDYLSIDTEGSELEILRALDFSARAIHVITVEHNATPQRAEIHELLTGHGYRRMFENLSRWDDWYVHRAAPLAQPPTTS